MAYNLLGYIHEARVEYLAKALAAGPERHAQALSSLAEFERDFAVDEDVAIREMFPVAD